MNRHTMALYEAVLNEDCLPFGASLEGDDKACHRGEELQKSSLKEQRLH